MKLKNYIQNKKTGVVLLVRPVDNSSDLIETGNYVVSTELQYDLYLEKRILFLEALTSVSKALRKLDEVNSLEIEHGTVRLSTSKMLLEQLEALETIKKELNEYRTEI